MADLLSSSKRKYIESWRRNVCHFMENGNICRVVVGEMTPEPDNVTSFHSRRGQEDQRQLNILRSPQPTPEFHETNDHLPAVKFVYSHGGDELQKQADLNNNHNNSMSRNSYLTASSKRRRKVRNMEVHDIRSPTVINENSLSPVELPDLSTGDTKLLRRKSSRTAKELYDKYNMKSEKHKFPSSAHGQDNGMHVYHMPWRNKTFLTLPLRFNNNFGSARNNFLVARQRTSLSQYKQDNESRGSGEWNDADW